MSLFCKQKVKDTKFKKHGKYKTHKNCIRKTFSGMNRKNFSMQKTIDLLLHINTILILNVQGMPKLLGLADFTELKHNHRE